MKKRVSPSFDPEYFKKLKEKAGEKPHDEIFSIINARNHWAARSKSGPGSDDIQTAELRKRLPQILDELDINTLLDLPCGDFNWLHKVPLNIDHYIGGDIVQQIVDHNKKKYANLHRTFALLDIINDHLPDADMLFCRDCFVHFSFKDIHKAMNNIKNSNISYLMTTTFTECTENNDIATGDWRIINLEKPPFHFPPPLMMINEKCTEGNGTYDDKSMGVWEINDLN